MPGTVTTLHFVRHGETDWNRQGRFQGVQDIPLNDEGRRQAQALASAWNLPAEVLISSPLSRARETAEILGRTVGLAAQRFDPLLIERDYGQGAGLTMAERRSRFPDGKIPGVEAPLTIQGRARAFLDLVVRDFAGRTVVAVSHGGLINVVLWLVSGGEVGTGKSILGNASVSTVVHRTHWTVTTVGRTFSEALALGE